MHSICRKDFLARNLGRMQKHFPEEYNFFPTTWVLPNDANIFNAYLREGGKADTFIYKPENGCQGKGISLFKGSKPPTKGHGIVQKYLGRPCLVDGYGARF
jgi:hypothetical protein